MLQRPAAGGLPPGPAPRAPRQPPRRAPRAPPRQADPSVRILPFRRRTQDRLTFTETIDSYTNLKSVKKRDIYHVF